MKTLANAARKFSFAPGMTWQLSPRKDSTARRIWHSWKCVNARRGLVTLDMDFANPLSFPPSKYPGIAVLRLPARPSHEHLLGLVRTLAGALQNETLTGKLWIVEIGRIRVYQEEKSQP